MPYPLKIDQRTAFCYEYLANEFNATKAAINAGASPKTAHATASRWLKDSRIQKIIKDISQKHYKKLAINTDKILGRLATIAFSAPKDFMEWGDKGVRIKNSDKLGDENAAIRKLSITEYKMTNGVTKKNAKIELADPVKSLQLLGDNVGLFPKDVRMSGKVSHIHKVELSDEELNNKIVKLLERATDVFMPKKDKRKSPAKRVQPNKNKHK